LPQASFLGTFSKQLAIVYGVVLVCLLSAAAEICLWRSVSTGTHGAATHHMEGGVEVIVDPMGWQVRRCDQLASLILR